MPICNFLFVELTNLYPWIDSKLHEEIEPRVFCLMAASPAFSSVGWLNLSLVNIAEGLGCYILGKKRNSLGKLHGLAGGGESGHSTYKAASENSGPAAKHPGFHWPQPQSWCLLCEVHVSFSSSFSFSGYAGSIDINTSQSHYLSRGGPIPSLRYGSQHIKKRGCHL